MNFFRKKVLHFLESCCFFEKRSLFLHLFTFLLITVNQKSRFFLQKQSIFSKKPRLFSQKKHRYFLKNDSKILLKNNAFSDIKFSKSSKKRGCLKCKFEATPFLDIYFILHNELNRAKRRVNAQQNYSLRSRKLLPNNCRNGKQQHYPKHNRNIKHKRRWISAKL